MKLEPHRVLHEPGEKLRFAYFLNSGLASLLAMMREGKAVEAGVVGFERISVGTALAVSLLEAPCARSCKSAEMGLGLMAQPCRLRFERCPIFRCG